jgi:ligand-binding SRPBCC domain-containing protein
MIEVASRLDASTAEVWERIITPEGINDELMPLMRMTLPEGVTGLDVATIVLGEPLGRSWVLLFGFIPVDYDEICLTSIDEGKGFLEESKMFSQRYWRHERTLEPQADGGTLVTDRVAWEPRLRTPASWHRPMFRFIFRHRHKRLRRHFGGEAVGER